MTQNTIMRRVEELGDVVKVEQAAAENTYVVWINGFSEPQLLEEIEHVSGWSFSSFNSTQGVDIGLCYVNTDEEHDEFEYGVEVTAFDRISAKRSDRAK